MDFVRFQAHTKLCKFTSMLIHRLAEEAVFSWADPIPPLAYENINFVSQDVVPVSGLLLGEPLVHICISQVLQDPFGVIHWEIQDSTSEVLIALNDNVIVVSSGFLCRVPLAGGHVGD